MLREHVIASFWDNLNLIKFKFDDVMNTVCVLGLGTIGLPTAVVLASHGHRVIGVDVNLSVIHAAEQGYPHCEEPGLRDALSVVLKNEQLSLHCQPCAANVFIIAVPTPLFHTHNIDSGEPNSFVTQKADSVTADLSCIIEAAESIVPFLRKGNLVILESTSPVGTTETILSPILEKCGLKVGQDLFVAYCPERVLPGNILSEVVNSDRIIGGVNCASGKRAEILYRSFVVGEIHLTDSKTAEMVKIIENTYRDVNIALANELALVTQSLHIDVWTAINMANRHPRVNIHRPGPGVGGHCIAVDPWFIALAAPDKTPLIQIARNINDNMPQHVVNFIRNTVSHIDQPTLTCLGLTYKANAGDVRASPALTIVDLLERQGFNVRSYDPHVSHGTHSSQVVSMSDALIDTDCVVLLVDHDYFKQEFQGTDFWQAVENQIIIDTNNAISPTLAMLHDNVSIRKFPGYVLDTTCSS